MGDGKLIAVVTTRTFIYLETIPSPDHICKVTFQRAKGNDMGALIGTVVLGPTIPGDHVTSRMVTVTVNSVALPPVEGITTPPTFPCNDGDSYSVVSVASNAVGSAPPSNIVSGTASLPQGVPSPDIITGVSFASADAPAPAPNA